MKIGISTACFGNSCQTEDGLSRIKQLGAEVCEIHLKTFYEYRPEFAKKYVQNAAGTEVFSVCAQPFNFERQLFSENRRIRGDGLYWLDQIARSAQVFGAKNYLLRGAAFERGCAELQSAPERLGEVAEFCSRYGLNLCIENSLHGIYSRPDLFKELKSRNISVCGSLNLAQARKARYPYQTYISDMAGSIACARLSDVDQNGVVCLPGQGVLDFKEIFKRLKDAGFDGCVLLGNCNCGLEELKKSVEFINEIIYGLI